MLQTWGDRPRVCFAALQQAAVGRNRTAKGKYRMSVSDPQETFTGKQSGRQVSDYCRRLELWSYANYPTKAAVGVPL